MDWRINGSLPSRPMKRWIQAFVPTLPTPTTFRAVSTKRYSSSGWCSRARERRYVLTSDPIHASSSSCSIPGGARSWRGTTSGGSAMNRSSPSTVPTSFVNTRRWSRVSRLGEIGRRVPRTHLRHALLAHRRLELRQDRLDVDVVVPDVDRPHPRGAANGLPVGLTAAATISRRTDGLKPMVAPADLEARGQPLHVPFPRPGKRLVEVVDVEDQLPLGRREDAEVRQMGVPAELHGDARSRRRVQIGRHDQRRAAKEREWRDEHPAVPHRDEIAPHGRRPAPPAAQPDRAGRMPAPTFHGSIWARRHVRACRVRSAPPSSAAAPPGPLGRLIGVGRVLTSEENTAPLQRVLPVARGAL